MTLAQGSAVAFCAGFFLTLLAYTIRVWRRIGYCPVTTFASRNPKEILRLLIVWSIPPAFVAAAWRPDPPAFRAIEVLARIEVQAAGAALLAAGLVLFPIACAQLGDAWRIGLDPKLNSPLVTRGLYSRIRHPIYTSFTLMYAGVFLCGPTPFVAVISGIACLGFYVRALLEEQFLVGRFGDEYRAYMKRTSRLFPGF